MIWTGSDDGLVHVTRDGGKTWTNVTPKDMPDFGRVSQIDASKFDDGTAYMSVRKPLLNDFSPYIFKTTDYGRTWTKIVNGIRADAYVHAVREDPTRKGLLYAGTQHGVYISYDDGAAWSRPVAQHARRAGRRSDRRGERAGDRVARPRLLDPRQHRPAASGDAADHGISDVHVFTPPPGYRSGAGLTISYLLRNATTRATLEILDSTGAVLRTMEADTSSGTAARPRGRRRGGEASIPARAGLNRFEWDLRTQGIVSFPGMILWGAGTAGPAVPPGRYTARLTADNRVSTAPLVVKRNPWITDVTDADLVAQYQFGRRVRDKATDANKAVIAVRNMKAQLADRQKKAADDAALKAAGSTLVANASVVEDSVYQVRNQSGQDPLNFPIRVNNRLATLLSMAERGDGRPTTNMPEIFGILSTQLGRYTTRLSQIWATDLVAVNKELARLRLAPIDPNCAKAEGCTGDAIEHSRRPHDVAGVCVSGPLGRVVADRATRRSWRRAARVDIPDVIAAQGVATLPALDHWYREEKPRLFAERRLVFVTLPELIRVTEWKMHRGVWRGPNLVRVKGNPPDDVIETTVRALSRLPHPTQPIGEIATLDGVGPATASAVVAALMPSVYPFFDELVAAQIPDLGPVKWTLGYYARYAASLRARASEIDADWTPVMVERALWAAVGGKAGRWSCQWLAFPARSPAIPPAVRPPRPRQRVVPVRPRVPAAASPRPRNPPTRVRAATRGSTSPAEGA
ncbi:MAG: hypothetical protein U5K74_13235, partial [Gemmatimonadaceae bacterium]|nr:hypothetical protein [Gemmatimonadaceae bacterium]